MESYETCPVDKNEQLPQPKETEHNVTQSSELVDDQRTEHLTTYFNRNKNESVRMHHDLAVMKDRKTRQPRTGRKSNNTSQAYNKPGFNGMHLQKQDHFSTKTTKRAKFNSNKHNPTATRVQQTLREKRSRSGQDEAGTTLVSGKAIYSSSQDKNKTRRNSQAHQHISRSTGTRTQLLQMKSERERAPEAACRKTTVASKHISETQDQGGIKEHDEDHHEEDCSGQDCNDNLNMTINNGATPRPKIERNAPSMHAASESEEDKLEDGSQNGRCPHQKSTPAASSISKHGLHRHPQERKRALESKPRRSHENGSTKTGECKIISKPEGEASTRNAIQRKSRSRDALQLQFGEDNLSEPALYQDPSSTSIVNQDTSSQETRDAQRLSDNHQGHRKRKRKSPKDNTNKRAYLI